MAGCLFLMLFAWPFYALLETRQTGLDRRSPSALALAVRPRRALQRAGVAHPGAVRHAAALHRRVDRLPARRAASPAAWPRSSPRRWCTGFPGEYWPLAAYIAGMSLVSLACVLLLAETAAEGYQRKLIFIARLPRPTYIQTQSGQARAAATSSLPSCCHRQACHRRSAEAGMVWPSLQDFNDAVQDPRTCFGDAELAQATAATDNLGLPKVCSGNFAVVYQIAPPTASSSGPSSASPSQWPTAICVIARSAPTCSGPTWSSPSPSTTWSRASASRGPGIRSSRWSGSRG